MGRWMHSLGLLVLLLLTACNSTTTSSPETSNNGKERNVVETKKASQTITPQAAKKLLAENQQAVLVDVRTVEENKEKRIPGSILIPYDVMAKEAGAKLTNKEAPIILYCRSGRRSGIAAKELVNLGYQNVYDMGPIDNWPYETESGK